MSMGLFDALNLIREGVLQSDWQKVCDGFEGMAGTKLEAPKKTIPDIAAENTLLQIAQLVNDHYSVKGDTEVNVGTAMAQLQAAAMRVIPTPATVAATMGAAPVTEAGRSEEEEILNEDNKPSPHGKIAAKVGQQLVVDPESAAARRVKDSRHNLDMDKFRVDNRPKSEKGTQARTVDWKAPDISENRFKPDPNAYRKEAKESQELSATASPKTPRPEPIKVHVECSRCHREEDVEPIQAPKRLDGGDNATAYVCNGCIKKARRSE